MQGDDDRKLELSTTDQLHEAVDRMLEPFGITSPKSPNSPLSASASPFEIGRPNQHDSKAEFQREMKTVENSIDRASGIIDIFVDQEEDAEHAEMLERLRPVIDQKFRDNVFRTSTTSASDLVRKNAAEISGFYSTVLILLDFRTAMVERKFELEDQKSKFWKLPHRAPD